MDKQFGDFVFIKSSRLSLQLIAQEFLSTDMVHESSSKFFFQWSKQMTIIWKDLPQCNYHLFEPLKELGGFQYRGIRAQLAADNLLLLLKTRSLNCLSASKNILV